MQIKSSLKTVLQEFGSHYKKCLTKEWPVPRDHAKTLRVSGFPYCGLRHWYTNTIQVGGAVSFPGSYYTGVGTLAHAIIQGWMGEGRRMYGNWKCKAEGCSGTREFDNRNDCPVCQSQMEYVEFEVHAFRYVTGHIDGLYKAADGTWWIIDYKTSSTRNIEEHRWSPTPIFPYKKNKWQIRAYVVLLERKLKIKIKGWILFYCFHPDTYIETDKGKVKIKDIITDVSKYKALSYNHGTDSTEYRTISDGWLSATGENLVEIEYEGGSIKVTESHEVWSVTRNTYVKAKDIQEGEEVLACD